MQDNRLTHYPVFVVLGQYLFPGKFLNPLTQHLGTSVLLGVSAEKHVISQNC